MFLSLQNNVARVHYPKYANAAKWSWREIMLTTIWSIRQKWVDVDQETHKFVMPKDMDRLLTVSEVDDCGNTRPLTYDPNMNTLRLDCPPAKCGCLSCKGKDTLCALVENIQMSTEDVIINSQVYTKRIYSRTEKDGTIYQVAEIPVWDPENPDGPQVVYDNQYTTICKCEVNQHGCIVDTSDNRLIINRYLGCFIINCHRKICDAVVPEIHNHYGYWREGSNNENAIYLKHSRATKILLSYQTNGGTDEVGDGEIMIPDFAIKAFWAGIQHYSTMFDRTEAVGNKNYYDKQFIRAMKKVRDFMSPVPIDEFIKLDTLWPTWGGLNKILHYDDRYMHRL